MSLPIRIKAIIIHAFINDPNSALKQLQYRQHNEIHEPTDQTRRTATGQFISMPRTHAKHNFQAFGQNYDLSQRHSPPIPTQTTVPNINQNNLQSDLLDKFVSSGRYFDRAAVLEK